eukprot:1569096-Ditylum_brightwellii.AAC.1
MINNLLDQYEKITPRVLTAALTAGQILTMATYAVQRTAIFQEALRKCKAKPAVDKTWGKFKKFCVDAYAES